MQALSLGALPRYLAERAFQVSITLVFLALLSAAGFYFKYVTSAVFAPPQESPRIISFDKGIHQSVLATLANRANEFQNASSAPYADIFSLPTALTK